MVVQENHGHIIEPCFIVNHGKYEHKSQTWLSIVTMDHGGPIELYKNVKTVPWITLVNYHGWQLLFKPIETMLNHCQD